MRKYLFAASAAVLCLPCIANAAILRPFTQTTAATVRLADLFDDLGRTPDRVLGRGPAPGARIVLGAPQLAAIARDFSVDWRPATGAEQAVIERRGDVLPRAAVLGALRTALMAAGAPDGAEIAMPEFQPITIPAGSTPVPDIFQCNYDPAGGRFTALVSVASADMPAAQLRVSGAVIVLAPAAVPTHRLARGSAITPADIEPMRVRVSLLHGNAAIPTDRAMGMVLKHDVQPGQPLTALDLERPELVLRGSIVRMSLNSEGIVLAAEGIARESGAEGDRVHVENPTSHAIVEAEVTGPGEVRVAPRGVAVSLAAAQ
jgi:flagella basal body P-ring formation protein FlgA